VSLQDHWRFDLDHVVMRPIGRKQETAPLHFSDVLRGSGIGRFEAVTIAHEFDPTIQFGR